MLKIHIRQTVQPIGEFWSNHVDCFDVEAGQVQWRWVWRWYVFQIWVGSWLYQGNEASNTQSVPLNVKYYKSTFLLQNCELLNFLIEIGWFWVCWIQQYIISGRKEVSRHSVSYIISITLVVNTTLFIHINKNNIFLSSSDRNFALAHFMKEMQCFPEGTDVKRVMDLYFQVRLLRNNVVFR